MTCSNPPALTDEQLNAALDGLADEAVTAHLERCDFCRAEFETIRAFDERLKSKLHRWDCPSLQVLGDYELNLLTGDEFKTVKSHVRSCPRCQAELNTLRDFLSETENPFDEALEILPETHPEPQRRVNRKTPAQILVAEPLQHVTAYASRGVAALRGAAEPGIDLESQPLHEVKGITIFMEVQDAPNHQLMLVGQLILDSYADWADALVELRQGGRVKVISAVNDTAGFRCRLTNRDPFDVTITSRKGTVLLLRDVQPRRS